MTSQRLHRSTQAYASTSQAAPIAEGMAISIAGSDGTVIATVCCMLEPPGGPSDGEAAMSVVSVEGDVDLDTAPLLERALIVAINDRPRTCLDLRHVEFFSAAGVHVLLAAHRHATRLGHSLTLQGVHGITERVLAIVGLDHVIPTVA
jgi:anti-sigma B factor antagonist